MDTRFGEFRFDPATRQLFRAGVELPLSPKAFELLRLLIEHRPRALSKSELQQLLWPATFVSEGNLPLLVSQIRAALGDCRKRARFVRTVHRFGYSFCGSVIEPAIARPTALVAGPMCWVVAGTGACRCATATTCLAGIRRPRSGSIHRACRAITPACVSAALMRRSKISAARMARSSAASASDGVVPLKDGDEVRLGLLVLLTFRIESPVGTTETQGTASEHR